MKTLYIDCTMGVRGDTLAAALYELLDDAKAAEFTERMNALGLANINVDSTASGTVFGTLITESPDEAIASVMTAWDIRPTLLGFPLSGWVKKNVECILTTLAEARGVGHGKEIPVNISASDLALTLSTVVLVEMLGEIKIICSAIQLGSGYKHTECGLSPIPTPTVAHILRGVPIYAGEIEGELCSALGAAIIKHFSKDFEKMPMMRVDKIGYGVAKGDVAGYCRSMLGYEIGGGEVVHEFTCTLDDMTPEKISAATERLFEAGALEVYTAPVVMKKSRLGTMLCVMCRASARDEIIRTVFKHTTTLGIRENTSNRYALCRRVETKKTPLGDIRIKYSEGFGVRKYKYEHDDVARVARENDLSIDEAEKIISRGEE